MLAYTRDILKMPAHWILWVGILIGTNGVAPWFFLGSLEAKVTLVVFLVGAIIQLVVHARFGFVRLLGLGHILWLVLVPWLAWRLMDASLTGAFGLWLFVTVVLNGISVLIDIADVVRYLRGERDPTV